MNCDSDLFKYYSKGRTQKRKRPSAIDLILEDQPHLKEYARQRTLVSLNMRRRVIKSMRKAKNFPVKQLCRETKIV